MDKKRYTLEQANQEAAKRGLEVVRVAGGFLVRPVGCDCKDTDWKRGCVKYERLSRLVEGLQGIKTKWTSPLTTIIRGDMRDPAYRACPLCPEFLSGLDARVAAAEREQQSQEVARAIARDIYDRIDERIRQVGEEMGIPFEQLREPFFERVARAFRLYAEQVEQEKLEAEQRPYDQRFAKYVALHNSRTKWTSTHSTILQHDTRDPEYRACPLCLDSL